MYYERLHYLHLLSDVVMTFIDLGHFRVPESVLIVNEYPHQWCVHVTMAGLNCCEDGTTQPIVYFNSE